MRITPDNASLILTASGETVTAGSVILSAAGGNIGTSSSSPYSINTTSLTATTNSAYFSDSSNSTTTPITVSNSTVDPTGTFSLVATSTAAGAGNIAIAPGGLTSSIGSTIDTVELVSVSASVGTSVAPVNVDASNVTLQANGAGQNVFVSDVASGTVTAVKDSTGGFANGAAGQYNLTSGSASLVRTGSGETVTAGSVQLTASSGTIGTSCTSPFALNTTALTAVAQGSAFFSDASNSTSTPITISNSKIGVAGKFYMQATSSTAGAGSIAVGGTGITSNTGGTVNTVELISNAGSVGTSSAPVLLNAARVVLQANSTGQNVYATDSASVNVTAIKDASCNCDNGAGGVYSLTAGNTGFLLTGAGETVTAGSIALTASNGTIGTSATSPFSINATALTAAAKNSAYFARSIHTYSV